MIKFDTPLAVISVWAVAPEMVDEGPLFLDDPGEIVANPSTRKRTLFRTLTAAMDSIFLDPSTHSPERAGD